MQWKQCRTLAMIATLPVTTAAAAMGQAPTPAHRYPANDTPVTLTSGTIVRLRNVVVFEGPQGKSLTLYIESPTTPSDSGRLAREARELVDLHGEPGRFGPFARVAVGVCRTVACLELREAPREMFIFLAQPDGSWQAASAADR